MRKAQEHLNLIDQDVISFHATEMVARMVLNMADDIVLQFQCCINMVVRQGVRDVDSNRRG